MTLKVVGANPIIYLILDITVKINNFNYTLDGEPIKRNPSFTAAWAYEIQPRPTHTLTNHITSSDFVKFFTKKRNYNKLFIAASTGFFLSPGIVLRHYSDPEVRHLKKRPKTWVHALTALVKVSHRSWVVELSDLFGKKEFLLRRIFTQKLPVSWFFFRMALLNPIPSLKPKRRIKRWVKKKYFRLDNQSL